MKMMINRILNVLIVLIIVVLICFFCFEVYTRNKNAELLELAEQEAANNRIPTDENAINFVKSNDISFDNDVVVLNYDSFKKNAIRTSFHVGETSVSYNFSKPLISGGSYNYTLYFKMRAENEAAQVDVKFGIEHTCFATTEWREFYIPCTSGEIERIKLILKTPFQRIYLSDVTVFKHDPLFVKVNEMKNGSYSVDGIETYRFDENDGIGAGKTMDITGDGEYLYSVGDGTLKILRISDRGATFVSSLSGIGNVRHIELRDKKHLAVASRENGVYIINIENKAKPYVESYYDALELANDVSFSGNYMFVASRYFGVEIVDITDINNPVFVSKIVNEKECYRCIVDENRLFISCWATGEVEIYDISDLCSPVLSSTIPVVGRCAEVFIDENIAYIVSGYNDFVNSDEPGNAGYGTGNALNIYDISDINKPAWKSTIKTEGSLYGSGYDDWSVVVSDGYAYFTNSFGGMYIYNVENPNTPLSIAHIAVSIPYSSANFVDFSKYERGIFPYDITKEIYSPIMGVYIDEGKIFFACAYNDVYMFEFNEAKFSQREVSSMEYVYTSKEVNSDEQYSVHLSNYDMFAIEKYNNMYVAATDKGLLLLDSELKIISEYITSNPVKDVKVTSLNYIVTAEKKGISIYKIENNSFIRMGMLASSASNCNVSSIGVTGDGRFVITQSSWTKFEAIDISNPAAPYFVNDVISKNGQLLPIQNIGNIGSMYYRNIVSGTLEGCVGISGNNNIIWFASENGKLRVKNLYANKFASETNGSAVLQNGQEIISVYNNGYVVYDPIKANENTINKLERYSIRNVRLKGKASVGGNILTICNQPNGMVYILNIKEPNMPYMINKFHLENTPGIPLVECEWILIPVRHGGIVKVMIE